MFFGLLGYGRIHHDGKFVAIDHGKQLVSVWNTSAATEIVAFSMLADVVKMAFSPGGELFASGDARGGVMVWQTDGIYLATACSQ